MPSRNTSVTATCSVCAAPLPPGRARRTCSDASAADTRTVSRARRSGVFHPIRLARAAGRSALRRRGFGVPACDVEAWLVVMGGADLSDGSSRRRRWLVICWATGSASRRTDAPVVLAAAGAAQDLGRDSLGDLCWLLLLTLLGAKHDHGAG